MLGQRHRKNVATHNRRGGFAGRGGLRGGRGGRGGGRAPAPVKVEIKVKEKELNDDARAEYDRVFAEKLAGNTDLEVWMGFSKFLIYSVLYGPKLVFYWSKRH